MLAAMRIDLRGATELELSQISLPALDIQGDAGGEGFGALQMLAASLALCTGAVLATYAENVLKIGTAGLRLGVSWAYAERPFRVKSMELRVHWPELPEDRLDAVRRAAASCTVHRTLENPPEITTTVDRTDSSTLSRE